MNPSSVPNAGLRRMTWIILAHFAISVLMTWPLALYWTKGLPGGVGDVYWFYWSFWHWKTSFLNLSNPLFSGLLAYPTGLDLTFSTHSYLNQVLFMPVNILFGEAAALNTAIIFSRFVTGLTMFLFLDQLLKLKMPAMLGSLVFAYFPNIMEQSLEHLNLVSTHFIPLSFYALCRINYEKGYVWKSHALWILGLRAPLKLPQHDLTYAILSNR